MNSKAGRKALIKMATGAAGAVNLNINLRKDARPEELLKELALSPLIYIRLAGIVSQNFTVAWQWISILVHCALCMVVLKYSLISRSIAPETERGGLEI